MATIAIIIAGMSLTLSVYLLFAYSAMQKRLDIGGEICNTLDAIRKEGECRQKEDKPDKAIKSPEPDTINPY